MFTKHDVRRCSQNTYCFRRVAPGALPNSWLTPFPTNRQSECRVPNDEKEYSIAAHLIPVWSAGLSQEMRLCWLKNAQYFVNKDDFNQHAIHTCWDRLFCCLKKIIVVAQNTAASSLVCLTPHLGRHADQRTRHWAKLRKWNQNKRPPRSRNIIET